MPRIVLLLTLLFLPVSALAQARSNWTIDPAKTRIMFEVPAVGYSNTRGIFRSFDGRISVDFDRPSRSRVEFRVASGSVEMGSSGMTAYVRSPVLFNADKFPNISFRSTAVEKLDERTVRVTGDLMLLGVTRPATFIVEVERRRPGMGAREKLGFIARGTVRRSEFGMDAGVPLIADAVTVTVSSEAYDGG